MSSSSLPAYPLSVPHKFTPSGAVQPFPGNTVLCHLPPRPSPLAVALDGLRDRLATHPRLAPLYALLPPASWHVTLFEGVCDRARAPPSPHSAVVPKEGGDGRRGGGGRRRPDDKGREEEEEGAAVVAAGMVRYWPAELDPQATSLEECTALFERKLRTGGEVGGAGGFELGHNARPPYRLRIVGFSPLEVGIGVAVEGATVEEETRIRGLRDRLSERLGIRHVGHEGYGLHLSLAYLLRHLSPEQKQELTAVLDGFLEEGWMGREFELGAPEFCTFRDMFAFERLFYLGEEEPERKRAGGDAEKGE